VFEIERRVRMAGTADNKPPKRFLGTWQCDSLLGVISIEKKKKKKNEFRVLFGNLAVAVTTQDD
jgi:hypothetical protein